MRLFLCILALTDPQFSPPQDCWDVEDAYDMSEAFVKAEHETGIPAPLLAAVAFHESRLDKFARGRLKETGLMQLHPRHFPRTYSVRRNVALGARYLATVKRSCNGPPVYWLSRYNGRPCKPSSYSRAILKKLAEAKRVLARKAALSYN